MGISDIFLTDERVRAYKKYAVFGYVIDYLTNPNMDMKKQASAFCVINSIEQTLDVPMDELDLLSEVRFARERLCKMHNKR